MELEEASKIMLDRLHRAFEVMNWFASGEHHKLTTKSGEKVQRWGRVDHESVMGEVYATLASGFSEFKAAVNNIDKAVKLKVCEIGFRTGDDPNESDDSVVWVATNRKIQLTEYSEARYIKEINIGDNFPTGVDLIIK